jgi:hypothetical protein
MSPATKHPTKPRHATDKAVHRTLHLVSPVLEGPDVKELQESLNHLLAHYHFDWRVVTEDGEYGKRTAREAGFVADLIGLDDHIVTAAKRGAGHLSEQTQHILRNPTDRTKADRGREERRHTRFQKLRRDHKEGMAAAVKFMLDHVGVNEQPPESNRGPFPIDAAEEWFGLGAVPWCGCEAGYSIEKIGGLGHTGTWWPYAGSIREDAIAGRNGLTDINPIHADIGVVFTFFSGGDDHVGLCRGKTVNGMIKSVEGNTSSLTHDSDGGIIETKERSLSEVTCAALLTVN